MQLETKLRDKETARLETNQLLQVEKQRSAGLVADVERLRQQLQAAQQQLQAGQQQHANEVCVCLCGLAPSWDGFLTVGVLHHCSWLFATLA